MEVWILRGTDPETLEEKINKQLEEVEKVTGYKVEYSAMVAVEAKPLFREA